MRGVLQELHKDQVSKRFRFGIPPAKDKADFAFIQHMYSQLNEKGQAAIVCSQGVLFRGSVESKIREGLIAEDAIEAIIAIPEKLFFGTGIPATLLTKLRKLIAKATKITPNATISLLDNFCFKKK